MKLFIISVFFAACCVNGVLAEPVKSDFARQDGPRAATEFIRYYGPQQRYRIDLAAKPNRSFAVPVYFTYPERECHVLGFIHEHGSHKGDAGALRSMAVAAKIHGADAIVMRPLTDEMRGAMQGDQPAIFAHAVAIKWGPAPL